MGDLQIYEKYCHNKPRSESLWRQCSDCAFFQVNAEKCIREHRRMTVDRHICQICDVLTGMSEETGAQTGVGLLPAEACSENY